MLDIYDFRGKDKLICERRVRLHPDLVGTDAIKVKDEGPHLSLSERQWMQVERHSPRGQPRIAMNKLILRFLADSMPNMMSVSISDYLIADRNSRAIYYKEAHHG